MPHTMHSFEANQTVPAFLVKLWKLVEDVSCNDLIAWSDSGQSFIIKDQTRFSKELLPQYFKHNNMASFIRQLNMYGFRKVMNYEKSGLRTENDEMEFQHSFFVKGQSAQLQFIKRKIPNNKIPEPAVKSNNARDILTDLSSIREKQEHMDSMLMKMRKENELLWRELTNMRKKHKAQEHVIQKVIQFLVSIVQRSNQNIGVQRKLPRMLHDSPNNQANSQVSSIVDVLRNNSSNYITVPADKLVSPQGPVIHEVTELDHDHEENTKSPAVKSPEERVDIPGSSENEDQEIEYPLISCLSSPIDSSTIEPLGILEPLQSNTPVLNNGEDPDNEEFVLGVPVDKYVDEYISSPPINVISIPDEEPCANVISLPDSTDTIKSLNLNPDILICTSTSKESDFDDSLLSESLQTPKIPSIHIEDENPPTPKTKEKEGESLRKVSNESYVGTNQLHNEHNYQLALSEPSNVMSSPLTNDDKRCTNYISNSDLRFHNPVSVVEKRNTVTNHVITMDETLDWLQDHFSTLDYIDPNSISGLFNPGELASNETLTGEIEAQTNIKTEPVDIVGNELVSFTPSMFEFDSSQLLDCLNEESQLALEDPTKVVEQPRFLLGDALIQADQIRAASEAADYLLNNESPAKRKSPSHSKVQKLSKAKRRKAK